MKILKLNDDVHKLLKDALKGTKIFMQEYVEELIRNAVKNNVLYKMEELKNILYNEKIEENKKAFSKVVKIKKYKKIKFKFPYINENNENFKDKHYGVGETINPFMKPEEGKAYYVINEIHDGYAYCTGYNMSNKEFRKIGDCTKFKHQELEPLTVKEIISDNVRLINLKNFDFADHLIEHLKRNLSVENSYKRYFYERFDYEKFLEYVDKIAIESQYIYSTEKYNRLIIPVDLFKQTFTIPLYGQNASNEISDLLEKYDENIEWNDEVGTVEINGDAKLPIEKEIWLGQGDDEFPIEKDVWLREFTDTHYSENYDNNYNLDKGLVKYGEHNGIEIYLTNRTDKAYLFLTDKNINALTYNYNNCKFEEINGYIHNNFPDIPNYEIKFKQELDKNKLNDDLIAKLSEFEFIEFQDNCADLNHVNVSTPKPTEKEYNELMKLGIDIYSKSKNILYLEFYQSILRNMFDRNIDAEIVCKVENMYRMENIYTYADEILKNSKKGDVLICSGSISAALTDTKYYERNHGKLIQAKGTIYKSGMLEGRYLYTDPYMKYANTSVMIVNKCVFKYCNLVFDNLLENDKNYFLNGYYSYLVNKKIIDIDCDIDKLM